MVVPIALIPRQAKDARLLSSHRLHELLKHPLQIGLDLMITEADHTVAKRFRFAAAILVGLALGSVLLIDIL